LSQSTDSPLALIISMSAPTVASDGSPTHGNDSVCDILMRHSVLKPDEKEFVMSVCNLLIFEAGACMLGPGRSPNARTWKNK
jgi:hypothetical protein